MAAAEDAATPVSRVPMVSKNSFASTWRKADKASWNFFHWVTHILDLHESVDGRPIPVHQKTDKVGWVSHWQFHRFILLHAFWPLVVQQAITWYTGYQFSAIAAFVFYNLAFYANGVHAIRAIRELGHQCGFLDGDVHERDGVPEYQASNIIISLIATATMRPMMCVFFAYDSAKEPISISLWTIVEIGVYQVVLDFYFYWYHRCMHEVEFLWRFHKKHHTTKHPNPMLTLYADSEQEIFDIIVVPLLTFLTMRAVGLPMGFYDWWVCQMYVVITELWGHSGVRVMITPATTATPLLKIFGGELTIEDHDLHHRQGWKNSHNYGKQTCLWDRIFGTLHERIELVPQTIDWDNQVTLPML